MQLTKNAIEKQSIVENRESELELTAKDVLIAPTARLSFSGSKSEEQLKNFIEERDNIYSYKVACKAEQLSFECFANDVVLRQFIKAKLAEIKWFSSF